MKGIAVGLALAALVLSCAVNSRRVDTELQTRIDKMNEITQLWVEIRRDRGDLGMPLDPSPSTEMMFRDKPVQDARRVCPDNHAVPTVCTDTCNISDHICENAELICKIADELGKNDRAQEKCTSGKASCREAKQRCCNCSSKPPVVTPPAAAPASPSSKTGTKPTTTTVAR